LIVPLTARARNAPANGLGAVEYQKRFRESDLVRVIQGAVREVVGIGHSAFSGNMKVSFQAARSIGWSPGFVASVCQPSTLRMLICP